MYTDIRPACAELDRYFDGGDPSHAFFAAGRRILELESEGEISRGDISRLRSYVLAAYQQALKKPTVYQIRDDTRLDPVIDWFKCLPSFDVERRAIEVCQLIGVDYWDEDVYVAPAKTPDKPIEKSNPPPAGVSYEYEE